MLFLASMHADVRDLLLSTGMRPCTGGESCHYHRLLLMQPFSIRVH
jgi:hypothetical protein